jgi:hypothetical protein
LIATNRIVIPAKAGIHLPQRLLDSGSWLRCGRNDDFPIGNRNLLTERHDEAALF